jgi:hypothetical protein
MSPGRGLLRRALVGVGALTVLVLLPAQSVRATIQPTPWADFMCYHWPDYDSNGDGVVEDVDHNGKIEPGGLDTQKSCTNAYNRTKAAGYAAFHDANVTAWNAMGTSYAQSDAIWGMFGHAFDYQALTTWDTTHGTTVLRYDSNTGGSGQRCTSPDACLHTGYTSAQLHYIRLMIFGGCHTACPWGTCTNGHSSAGPNLPQDAWNKGVDSAMGWDDFISWPGMDLWTDSFFRSATTYYSSIGGYYTVFQAGTQAETDVYNYYGSYYGTNRWVVWGGSTKLIPVKYGS